MTTLENRTLHLWRLTKHHICPICTCTDPDWRSKEGNEFLKCIALVEHAHNKDSPEDGSGVFPIFKKESKLLYHLGAHFFEYEVVSDSIKVHVQVASDNKDVKCAVQGCKWQIAKCDGEGGKFIAHMVNKHRLPLLRYGDGSFVEEVKAGEETALEELKP